ncbi:MAG TPA: DUF1572 family protein [Acidobacteriaceae bacterium]|jgi:hypothetical protein|nr:DUF1572 family protein [Acidobacteriaceae bacterium]
MSESASAQFQPTSTNLFLLFSRDKLLKQHWPRLRSCVESLTDEQIWWRPNLSSNSIGNLLLHLNGNVRQWLVDSFNRQEDRRDRPAEFATAGQLSGPELIARLEATLLEARFVLDRLAEADLLAAMEIQGYHVHGLDAVYQVVEHFGLHYGQIAYITKMLRGQDLGFYRELNTTGGASG